MRRIVAALGFAVLSLGQSAPPAFTLDHVIPSGRTRPTWLAPGMLISIYGNNLGPLRGCVGQGVNYPTELCGVQVFVGDLAAGLLYVQNDQINFQVPRDSAMEGTAELKVVYQGQANSPVSVRLGIEPPALSVDGVASVGGPVWIKIEMPTGGEVRYPARVPPLDFGCNQMEVRQNGVLLPRIQIRTAPMMINGPSCGNIQIPGHAPQHTGRLPLHLQYRFERPGIYEVRYTLKRDQFGPRADQVVQQSAWTRFEVFPAQARAPQIAPMDPEEILSDYLPGVMGFSDAAGLRIVLQYLYHPEEVVRRYAESALLYWPEEQADREAAALIRTKGPTDVLVDLIGVRRPDLIEVYLPYLASDNPVLLRGAIVGVSRLISDPRQALAADIRARAEDRLIASTEHILRTGDQRALMEFSVALGSVRDDRARDVLWDLVERRIASGQSLIAISWHKDVRDLPRLGALLTGPVAGDPRSTELASIPYAMRNSYGDAAVPFLEAGLKNSGNVWVRTNCARELIEAGRPSGFAFMVDAIQGNRPYKREMVQFVRDRFPELKTADEGAVLAFVKLRAI